MLDYRNKSASEIQGLIVNFSAIEASREEILDGLLSVAVWHSIKDGQITPAMGLLAATRGNKDRVCMYLTKFGNLSYSKQKGLSHSKSKHKGQNGLEKANEVFDNLPSLEDAFPSVPKEYRDIPFASQIKAILNKAAKLQENGKKFIFASDEEALVFDMLKGLQPTE